MSAKPIVERYAKLNHHFGNAFKIAIVPYNSFARVVEELARNAMDAGAKLIDITIDQKKKSIVLTEDGCGMTSVEFVKAMDRVLDSEKRDNPVNLGRHGIGMFAGLDKSNGQIVVTSKKIGQTEVMRATIDCKEILNSRRSHKIPIEIIPQERVSWNTKVEISKCFRDPVLWSGTTPKELGSRIRENANQVMLKQKVVIIITHISLSGKETVEKFVGQEFEGVPYGKKRIKPKLQNDKGPTVEIDLYKSGLSGQGMFIGTFENPNTIPSHVFFRRTEYDEGWIEPELLKELKLKKPFDGKVEGLIKVSKCRTLSSNDAFARDENLHLFFQALNYWYNNMMKPVLAEINSDKKMARLRKINELTNKGLEMMLSRFPKIGEFFIGAGDQIEAYLHQPSPHKDSLVEDDVIIQDDDTETNGEVDDTESNDGKGKKDSESDPGPKPKTEPKDKPKPEPKPKQEPKDKPKVIPIRNGNEPCFDPKRKVKRMRGRFTGISFVHRDLMRPWLWEFDKSTVTVIINRRHPIWTDIEEDKERKSKIELLAKLQEMIVFAIFNLETSPIPDKESLREVLEGTIRTTMFIVGD